MYSVRGRSAATGGAANEAIAQLWNPHATQIIRLVGYTLESQVAPAAAGFITHLRRTTARGTPGSTVTPDISNDSKRGAAPVSGALLDLAAFSVQPTYDGTTSWDPFYFTVTNPTGFVSRRSGPAGWYIPPGSGIAVSTPGAIVGNAFEVTFVWVED